MQDLANLKIAFIGFGEAAQAFLTGWRKEEGFAAVEQITAFDIKTDAADPRIVQAKQSQYAEFDVAGKASLEEALAEANFIVSLVTADQAHAAARAASKFLKEGAFFLDGNSCAPGTKNKSAGFVEKAGGLYVDTAIMAPVHPKYHKTPLSLSGAHIKTVAPLLEALGMVATLYSEEVGASSSLKMVRSIMIKGMEALMAECLLAGRLAGVEEDVMNSLDKSYPGMNFKEQGAYMLERSMTHGIRRAAEVREVAITVEELGLPANMSHAIVEWQQRIGDLKITAGEEDYQERADVVLKEMNLK